jgi:hypothetical protein
MRKMDDIGGFSLSFRHAFILDIRSDAHYMCMRVVSAKLKIVLAPANSPRYE